MTRRTHLRTYPAQVYSIGPVQNPQQPRVLSLLLAEDNPNDVEVLSEALEGCGLQTRLKKVEDCKALLKILLSAPHELSFDVAVLDANLAGQSSLAVLDTVRKGQGSFPMPVLILTAAISPADRAAFLDVGVDALLTKPLDLEGYSEIGSLLATFSRPG